MDWELMDGGDGSSRGAEAAKDCRVLVWNVRNFCETSGWFWILMVLSCTPFVNPIGQMTEVGRRRPMRMLRNYVQWKMSSSIMRWYPDPDSAWNFLIACDAELWNCGYEICKNRLDGSAVYPVCVKALPSIERRRSGVW